MNQADPSDTPSRGGFARRHAILALLGLGAAAGGAWWGWRRHSAPHPAHPTSEAGAAQGDPLPPGFWQVQFDTPQGEPFNWSGLQGKPLLLNFWATWCPPCLEEIPDLIALHDKHKDKDLVVLGVAMDYQSAQQVKDFAGQMFVSYPVILGTQASAAQVGPIGGLPTTYLFNPQGKMVAYNVGALTRKAVESYINAKK